MKKIKPGKGLENDGGCRDAFRFLWAENASLSRCHLSRNLFEEKRQASGNWRGEQCSRQSEQQV